MRYLSVCSGIEAATQAWHPLGWKSEAFSEIEPFPSAVLDHHYPETPNLGDMTKYEEWKLNSIDLLVGGTPCQSFSVAGLRKGLGDPRGNLMLTYGAIAKRFNPKWLVWENVPGVLSSNKGRDFGAFLGMLAELGYGFAYRILDTQFVRTCRFRGAIPQRRRRVFVVGHLGDWRRAAAILFDRESLRGNPPPSREAGQGSAGFTQSSIGGYCEGSGTLRAKGGDIGGGSETLCLSSGQANAERTEGFAPALNCNRDGAPIVCGIDEEQNATEEFFGTLNARQQGGGFEGAVAIQDATRGKDQNGLGVSADGAQYTLDQASQHAVAFEPGSIARNAGPSKPGPVCSTLRSSMGDNQPAVAYSAQVRRLTPVECERLQGFPDDFTRIPWRKKPADQCPDGPRYKALGNSMSVNVMGWIGERINLQC